ncbi:MAG: proton-conducting transporter membrane subunit, partial [Planctomycetota bacterium]
MADFPLLSLFTFAPVLGMLVIFCIPSKRGEIIKTVAAAAAAVPLIIGVYIFCVFRDDGGMHFYENHLWISGLNIYYKLGIDGISATLLALSGLVGFVAVVSSWGIEKQVKGYFALILLLLAGMNGVFCALDFFLFYVFWELMLLPMYFLIGLWGGPARVYAAIKFFLYTMAGSVLMLVVLLAVWYWSDGSYCSKPVVMAVKRAVLAGHAGLLQDIANEEKALRAREGETAKLSDAALAGLLNKHQIDCAGPKELRNYVGKLSDTVGKTDEELTAAIERIPLYRTFSFTQLKMRYRLFLGNFNCFGWECGFATVMFILLYVAFAIKVPVFPFHTWLPWAHVEAPLAGPAEGHVDHGSGRQPGRHPRCLRHRHDGLGRGVLP